MSHKLIRFSYISFRRFFSLISSILCLPLIEENIFLEFNFPHFLHYVDILIFPHFISAEINVIGIRSAFLPSSEPDHTVSQATHLSSHNATPRHCLIAASSSSRYFNAFSQEENLIPFVYYKEIM